MYLIATALILATTATPMESEQGETVFETRFEQGDDINFDQWPDHWTRRRGRGFPEYLRIGLVPDPHPRPDSTQCLRIELDGGGATVFSPPVPISSLFSYQLEGYVKTEGLKRSLASISLMFWDAQRQCVETHCSSEIRDAGEWTRLQIGPVTPATTQAVEATIGLHLLPAPGPDLDGAAMFDDLRLIRLPRMLVRTNRVQNLFTDPREIEIRCEVSGIQQPDAHVLYELAAADGRHLASHRVDLVGEPPDQADPRATIPAVHTAVWTPPVSENGFYEVRVSMVLSGQPRLERQITLAVLEPATRSENSVFGWSLPRGTGPLPPDELATLLGQVGIRWVKFPAWFGADDSNAAEQLAWFADRLASEGIDVVGLLDQPPADVRNHLNHKRNVSLAEVFMEPAAWHPAIDRIMLRLSLKVEWWQLGGDHDISFVQLPTRAAKVREIRDYFRQYSQRARVGLPWRWIDELDPADPPPWDFLAMTATPPLTGPELTAHLDSKIARAQPLWITLTPLPAGQYDLATRAEDLARRMVAAKLGRTEAVFLDDPFAADTGILHEDGSPRDLFLPWCTTAHMIGDSKYLGSIRLPNGSTNYVLQHGEQLVLVVWNERPTTETLYLGDDVQQLDLWGSGRPVPTVETERGRQQQLTVGHLPTFVVGLQPAVTRWRLLCHLKEERLPAEIGRSQPVTVLFQNTFPEGVGGTVKLITPATWEVPRSRSILKLAAEEQAEHAFEVQFQTDTNNGIQPVRIDFEITADQLYQFSVFRQLGVGLGDVEITANTWLDDQDHLIVRLLLTNRTDQTLDFNCHLFVPGRRRLREQVFDFASGQTTATFVVPRGRELLGRTLWLRVEEIGGSRLLNYHVVAEP